MDTAIGEYFESWLTAWSSRTYFLATWLLGHAERHMTAVGHEAGFLIKISHRIAVITLRDISRSS